MCPFFSAKSIPYFFLRYSQKSLDIVFCNLNVGNARVLLHKAAFEALLALWRFGNLLLALWRDGFHFAFLERLRGQFPGLDVKGYGLFRLLRPAISRVLLSRLYGAAVRTRHPQPVQGLRL